MPTFNSDTLLQDLSNDVNGLLNVLRTRIQPQPHAVLLEQPAPGSWSVIQCLDHLNSYGHYYLPHLHNALSKGEQKGIPAKPLFRSGWLGNYFTNLMQPKPDGALRSRMQAPQGYRPVIQPDAELVITEFISQQEQMLELLRRAGSTDIGHFRIPTSLTRFIKMSAGDTFRFLIAHEQRHMLQALRAMLAYGGGGFTAVSMQYLTGNIS
jgi:hypothetical protein